MGIIKKILDIRKVQLGSNSTPAPPDTEILSSGFWDDDGIWNDENPDILKTAQ